VTWPIIKFWCGFRNTVFGSPGESGRKCWEKALTVVVECQDDACCVVRSRAVSQNRSTDRPALKSSASRFEVGSGSETSAARRR